MFMNLRIKKIATLIDDDLHNRELNLKSNPTLIVDRDQTIQVNKFLKSLRRRIALANSSNLSN